MMRQLSCTRYLGDFVAGAVDVDLLDSEFATRVYIVAEEHLTKSTDAKLTTSFPVFRCLRT